ncbi:MAG: DUF362 domain-containing protein [Methanomassiliicoccales archaeon]
MSDVYFSDLRADRESRNVPHKIAKLFKAAGIDKTFNKGDLVAIKTHFGEPGSHTFLRPQFCAKVVDLVAKKGGRPFLTDANTLYRGGRADAVDHLNSAARHGFFPPVINAPIIIADGLIGKDQKEIRVDLKHCKTVKVGSVAVYADSIICVTHVKGHIATGFGGALKNLGMGFGSRAGKLEMHSEIHPKVKTSKCRGCGRCARSCPAGAIAVKKVARIDKNRCIGCGECFITCLNDAIEAGKDCSNEKTMEKIVEYCYGIMMSKRDKIGFISFVMDFTPLCDCPSWSDLPIIPDVGILASRDIVAIDQAAADLVNAQAGIPGSCLEEEHLPPGKDKIKALKGIDWTVQLSYAEKLGLGSRSYNLIRI